MAIRLWGVKMMHSFMGCKNILAGLQGAWERGVMPFA
jgi:hypothetical protein